ncbi:unnamed protein product [Cladocopium goreaui]|uniref:Insulysin n=1 Tax=Cladocopium goreaui TaxID=2562237 RepID=A0A9P1CF70_9DINO|nr:unnamed protein product [Cladocopium goreaui]
MSWNTGFMREFETLKEWPFSWALAWQDPLWRSKPKAYATHLGHEGAGSMIAVLKILGTNFGAKSHLLSWRLVGGRRCLRVLGRSPAKRSAEVMIVGNQTSEDARQLARELEERSAFSHVDAPDANTLQTC